MRYVGRLILVRTLAILIILFLINSAVYSSGWVCVLKAGACSEIAKCDDDPDAVPCEQAQFCPSNCRPRCQLAMVGNSCAGNGCPEEGVCDLDEEEATECVAVVACANDCGGQTTTTEVAILSDAPDNARCIPDAECPVDCKPVICILVNPIIATEPSKAPSPIVVTATTPLDLGPWSDRLPTTSPPIDSRGVNPIIETTVLRI